VTFDLFSFLLGIVFGYACMETFVVPALARRLRMAHDRRR